MMFILKYSKILVFINLLKMLGIYGLQIECGAGFNSWT